MKRQYQVVYQGYEAQPNQVVSNPLSFDDANWLACTLQADLKEDRQEGEFFIVEPIFSDNKKDK